jgi:6-phosphogluconolactonase (cycloisomerase 2 family)
MNTKPFVASLAAVILMDLGTAALAAWPQNWLSDDWEAVGAAYTMTNDPAGNQVVIFDRAANGRLTEVGPVPTGGSGSGGGIDALGSQGSLVLTGNGRWLLAVNAGSNEVSVFRVVPHGLRLRNKVASGGEFPVSLAVSDNLVYVLNAGGEPNITAFALIFGGNLRPLANSTRSLGGGAFAEVGFAPLGQAVVVTDKANSKILVFGLDGRGLPAETPVVSASDGAAPFGFVFDWREHLLVVESAANAVSSYDILDNDTLQTISASVPNYQQLPCWIASGGRYYVFTANPGTSSISSYLEKSDGSLSLRDGTAGSGNAPLDLATADNGRFLYAVDPANGGIDMYRIKADGSLASLGTVSADLSAFAQGIAAR